jgi:ssDNA thymidine ADP-ribosyltransferase DarT-like protein
MPPSQIMREKSLACLLYLVHPDNLESIMCHGILPQNAVRHRGLAHKSIASGEVQQRRDFCINGVSCHDFVPLYLARRNPMLWAIGDQPRAYIRVRLEVADQDDVSFADGNAASKSTGFVGGDFGARRLPWDVIFASRWTGSRYPDGKRQRCSEVLVPHPITCDQFLDIRVDLSTQFSFPSEKRHILKNDPAFLSTERLRGE